jgi:hypothetical protein
VIKLTDLLGQSAVSLQSAERTGMVRGVHVADGRVTSVDVGDGHLPASSIVSFEGDVLTYRGDASDDGPPSSNPIGQRVLDDSGDELGVLDDLHIAADGTVETVVLAGDHTLPGSRLSVIGSYAIIMVDDDPDNTATPFPPPDPVRRIGGARKT